MGLKNEKVHENLQKGIEGFTPDKLKAVKTKEPASGADLMKTEIATGATIKAVEGFDAAALKKAETVEKNSLPDQEAIKAELGQRPCPPPPLQQVAFHPVFPCSRVSSLQTSCMWLP